MYNQMIIVPSHNASRAAIRHVMASARVDNPASAPEIL